MIITMKKGVRSKIIIAAVLVIAAGAGGYAVNNKSTEVSAVSAERGSVEKIITETGSVEVLNSVVITSKIQGQLVSVNIREGDTVEEGQLLASYDRTAGAADIGSINAQISGLQVQLNQANELVTKNRRLYEEGAASYDELSLAETSAKQLESQISALRYSIESLSVAGGSKGVTTPMSGVVTSVMVSEGEIVAPGAALVEISDMSDIYVRVNLVSEDADEVSQGDAARVFSENDSLIDENASVRKIYLKAQDVLSDLGIYQKRVPLEIALSGGKSLRLGSNVSVEIVVDEKHDTIVVPENSIFEINREYCVYKIEDGKAKLQNVEIGLEGERYTEILTGLTAGDTVITSPAQEIEDGTKVKPAAE